MQTSPALPTPQRDLSQAALPDTQPMDDNNDAGPPVLHKIIILSERKDGLPWGPVTIIFPKTGEKRHGVFGSSRRYTYPN